MNKALFYDKLRTSKLLGPELSSSEFQGVNAILEYALSKNLSAAKISYILATAYHETAGTMQPIKERGGIGYLTRSYDIRGTNPARAKRMGNTKPGDGVKFAGRGFVQLTWQINYAYASGKLNIDLINFPDRALELPVATKILVEGMIGGWFTGRSLSLLPNTGYATNEQFQKARPIINGQDKKALIASYAVTFQDYFREAGLK